MANRVKGEVGFEVDGEDYVLLLDFNALCDLEDDLPGLMDGTAEIRSPKAIRRVFHAGLQAHHEGLTEREAGVLIQGLGLERAGQLVKESFAASFPEQGGKGPARPRSGPKGSPSGIGNAR